MFLAITFSYCRLSSPNLHTELIRHNSQLLLSSSFEKTQLHVYTCIYIKEKKKEKKKTEKKKKEKRGKGKGEEKGK